MLESSRVRLAPLRAEDAPPLYRWINDRGLVLLNNVYRPVTPDAHQAWFEAVQRQPNSVIFTIRDPADDRLMGTCQLVEIDTVARRAELRIRLGELRDQGRGLGTSAVRLLLGHAFEDLNLERVFLHVFATNERAIRCYLKAGFRQEGRLRRAEYVGGQYVDVVVMGILREEYLALSEREPLAG